MPEKNVDELVANLLDSMLEHNSELVKSTSGKPASKSDPMGVKELAEAFLYLRTAILENKLPDEKEISNNKKKK